MYTTLDYRQEGPVAVVALNRPERLNAFTEEMQTELIAVWEHIRAAKGIVSIVLTGRGRAFCSGVDVSRGDRNNREGLTNRYKLLSTKLTAKQNGLFKPVICAVNGLCAGGGFYFLGDADIPICSDTATFFDPHVSHGMACTVEPTILSRRIPLAWVLRISLMGLQERMSAQTAERIGLVTEITKPEVLEQRAIQIATAVAQNAPLALQATTQAIWGSLDMGFQAALTASLDKAQLYNGLTGERPEGVRAFMEKRRPDWLNLAPREG